MDKDRLSNCLALSTGRSLDRFLMMSSIVNMIDQHAEEAAFLAGLRDYAVRAPHYDLQHLTTLDNRIEAHLDGLRIAGLPGLDAVLQQLGPHAQGEVFAATVPVFETGSIAAMATLAEQVRTREGSERFMAAALGWLEWPLVEPWIERMLASPSPCSAASAWPSAACTATIPAPPAGRTVPCRPRRAGPGRS